MVPVGSSEEEVMENAMGDTGNKDGSGDEKPRPEPLPPGDYALVAWDIDTTGRRLIDEMCHLGAYASGGRTFSQFVMPFRDPNLGAVRRHHLRVINTDRYRMLKNMKSGKLLRTKSEVSSLTDFIQWLNEAKGGKEAVVLVFYEPRPVVSFMLLQALEKYELLTEFRKIVRGFVNGYEVAEKRCARTIKSYSLRSLSKIFLGLEDSDDDLRRSTSSTGKPVENGGGDKKPEPIVVAASITSVPNENGEQLDAGGGGEKIPPKLEEDVTSPGGHLDSASSRAKVIYQVLEKLVEEEGGQLTFSHLRDASRDVDWEMRCLDQLRGVLFKHSTLRPFFEAQLREGRRERQRATNLRRTMAEAGVDYDSISERHADVEGIKKWLAEKVPQLKAKDVEELVALIDKHFAPKPVIVVEKQATAASAGGQKEGPAPQGKRQVGSRRRRSLRDRKGSEGPATNEGGSEDKEGQQEKEAQQEKEEETKVETKVEPSEEAKVEPPSTQVDIPSIPVVVAAE